ncbi:trigger factor [Bdellovibrio bacteriovorus]|uniref:Trigger factor n=1 Tax=Bdellovibrio bacteriovorus (strain ATCC 15356 / DSM 50701 / NCIMB 9529 / HD100) TaxID=264462 RepID=TIG_BDEBA|nr:trigger factor [Bdellovibrio bacteriovorus]Q6MH01.1 RecName: Full=Trigger factor; Short=TF; AltName: Full=PPIase [Bdellovibrio bacteriovorus HD100]CAE81126.1 trigger factor [Bdellovibrio bacteriovorus HD100]
MKSNVEKVSNLSRKLNIEVPAAAVQTAFQKIFNGIQKEVTIKGFRKGKAPLATVKSLYGDRVKQDVVQDLIQKHYAEALNEHKLEPISYPEFEFADPTENKDFSFSAAFDVRPEITLKKYEGLEVEKEKAEFDPKKIDQVLENIRASRATFEVVAEDRAVKMGDIAVINFEGFMGGAPLENGSGTDHHLELGAKQFIEGFEDGIVGMKKGETKTLSLKFPDPYHSAELAGKPVEFKVTLNQIKAKVLPELTNEFLATLGGPSDLETLKKSIQEDLEQTETKRIEDAFKNRLLKTLVKENPVEVPPSLMKEQKASLVEDFKKRMSEQGMGPDDFASYVEKWDGDFEKTAAEMIQSSFLVDAIAKKHDLFCKKEDLDAKFAEYAQQTGIEESRIKEFYGRPEQASRLTYMLTEEKVIAFLNKSVKVKEVPAGSLKEENH